MEGSLARRTVRGISWSSLGSAVNAVFQIVFTAILARILDPADFGLIAMAGLILRFGSYFAQMGLGVTLVQKKTLDDHEIAGIFTSSVLLGGTFTLLAWLVAPWAGRFFADGRLVDMIRVLSLSFLFTGLGTAAMGLLRRNMRFGQLAVVDVVSYVIGYGAVGVLLARMGLGVWSLVYCSLLQRLLAISLAYAFTRHRLALSLKWTILRPLATFGGFISLITFLEFLGANLDTLLVGRFTSATDLGIYNKAYLLAQLPIQFFVTSITSVMLPALSKLQTDLGAFRKFYLNTYLLVGLVVAAASLGSIPAADQLFAVLLGDKWVAGIPLFRLFALATPVMFLVAVSGVALEALGRLKLKLALQTVNTLVVIVAYLLVAGFGMTGFAWAVAGTAFSSFATYTIVMERVLPGLHRELLQLWRKIGLVAGAVAGAIYGVTLPLNTLALPASIMLFIQIAVGFVVLTTLLAKLGYLQSAIELFKRRSGGVISH